MTDDVIKFRLTVHGDVVIDHHFYEGSRLKPKMLDHRGVQVRTVDGGAVTVHSLITAVLAEGSCGEWTTALHAVAPDNAGTLSAHHAVAIWAPFPVSEKTKSAKERVWRISKLMGYGNGPPATLPAPEPVATAPDLLVLDDAGLLFRLQREKALWGLIDSYKPQWVLLKMSDPVARGDLWHSLSQRNAQRHVVCLISARDVRRETVSLSIGLSWEQTLEELHNALDNHPVLVRLQACAHLVITFSADGALWIDRTVTGKPRAVLVFDPSGVEGEYLRNQQGGVVGSMTAIAAAIARALAWHVSAPDKNPVDLADGMARGLGAMRELISRGHGPVDGGEPVGFPISALADKINTHPTEFEAAKLLWPEQGAPVGWTIVEAQEHPIDLVPPLSTIGIARHLAIHGGPVLNALPHARFGDLVTVDRQDIEALRNIRSRMLSYKTSDATKPLSVGVFGPPGAGKSFGMKMLARDVFGDSAWLEFNLSQFNDERDLIGAFHQVRDAVLKGITPVVFWDEFDAAGYKWLQFLLAPMQDGRFQEGQLNHGVGKCVFVFAGGSSESYSDFGAPKSDEAAVQKFKLLKGPDFHSRLDTFYDVAGPNPRKLRDKDGVLRPDPRDVVFPLRRALLLRHHLGCKSDAKLDFDPDLLEALLLVPEYRHGSRSLEKMVIPLKPVDGKTVRRSGLTTQSHLAMHVNVETFCRILARCNSFRQSKVTQALAVDIHEGWRDFERTNGRSPSPELDMAYDDLDQIYKDDNQAAARRIPHILALAGLTVARTAQDNGPAPEAIAAQIEHHIERLAEAEHDGWMQQRFENGWSYSDIRDNSARLHDMLRPYHDLPPQNQDKDRNAVRCYPKRVKDAGYEVVWLTANEVLREHVEVVPRW